MIASIHLNYVLGDRPLTEGLATARKLGFTAVELPFPYSIPATTYRTMLADHGLTQISVATPACNYRKGEKGLSVSQALKEPFIRSVDQAIAYASEIGCKNVHMMAGAPAPGDSCERSLEVYCHNLAETHDRLAAEGIRLVIEAINPVDFPGYFMNKLALAELAIATAGRPGIGVVLDVYHAAFSGEDPARFLRHNTASVAHIQLADFPGRHEPGTGRFDFDRLFKAIEESQYSGSIGLEYIPTRPIDGSIPLARHLGIPMNAFRLTPL